MSVFRFKNFDVVNELSAMKVNTDGVLLGAVTRLNEDVTSVLDVGTGTGVIAMMIAQRMSILRQSFTITGIDIDELSVQEARINFENCKWRKHLRADLADIKKFHGSYDLIISNPPYFEKSLKSRETRRSFSRHADSMSYRDLIRFAAGNMSADGVLSMILPYEKLSEVLRFGVSFNIFAKRIIYVRTTEIKPCSKIIVELGFEKQPPLEETIVIIKNGKYSEDYLSAVRDFYLFA